MRVLDIKNHCIEQWRLYIVHDKEGERIGFRYTEITNFGKAEKGS